MPLHSVKLVEDCRSACTVHTGRFGRIPQAANPHLPRPDTIFYFRVVAFALCVASPLLTTVGPVVGNLSRITNQLEEDLSTPDLAATDLSNVPTNVDPAAYFLSQDGTPSSAVVATSMGMLQPLTESTTAEGASRPSGILPPSVVPSPPDGGKEEALLFGGETASAPPGIVFAIDTAVVVTLRAAVSGAVAVAVAAVATPPCKGALRLGALPSVATSALGALGEGRAAKIPAPFGPLPYSSESTWRNSRREIGSMVEPLRVAYRWVSRSFTPGGVGPGGGE